MILSRALQETVNKTLRIVVLDMRRLGSPAAVVDRPQVERASSSPTPDAGKPRAIARIAVLARRRALRLGWHAVRRHMGLPLLVRRPEVLCRVVGSLVEHRLRQRWSWVVQGCSRQGEQDALSIAERLAALNEDLLDAQRTQAAVVRSKGAVTIVLAVQRLFYPATLDAWDTLRRSHSHQAALARARRGLDSVLRERCWDVGSMGGSDLDIE